MPPWTSHDPIDIEKFDQHARNGDFAEGPWKDSFGDGYGDPYQPHRTVWGTLKDGRKVRSVKGPKKEPPR